MGVTSPSLTHPSARTRTQPRSCASGSSVDRGVSVATDRPSGASRSAVPASGATAPAGTAGAAASTTGAGGALVFGGVFDLDANVLPVDFDVVAGFGAGLPVARGLAAAVFA